MTRLAHAGTELVPLGFQRRSGTGPRHHDERDLHDLGELFWRETDPETDVAYELVAVNAFFYRRSGLSAHIGPPSRLAHSPTSAWWACASATRVA
jgi:hypothetical protein